MLSRRSRRGSLSRFVSALVLLFSIYFLFPRIVWGQAVDSLGEEFIVNFLPAEEIEGEMVAELRLSAPSEVMVSVEYPVNEPVFRTSVLVKPHEVTVVSLPAEAAVNGWISGTISNNSVRVYSQQKEFGVVLMKRRKFTSDASIAFPVDVLGKEYLAVTNEAGIQEVNFEGQLIRNGDSAVFSVVAVEDGTEVTITPAKDLVGGFTAGTPFQVTLGRGQGFLAESVLSEDSGDLTGSLIESTKPVSVVSGNTCSLVPPRVFFCDSIFQAALPLERWGHKVLTTDIPYRTNGSFYRAIAANDQTVLKRNGENVGVLQRGQFIEFKNAIGPQVFEADQPIQVVQFMTGSEDPGSLFNLGDPSMMIWPALSQYAFFNVFSDVSGDQFRPQVIQGGTFVEVPGQLATIIATVGDVERGTIFYDDEPMVADVFQPIGNSGYSYTLLEVQPGSHFVESQEGHMMSIIGMSQSDSYLYSGALLFESARGDGNPPVCFVKPDPSTPGRFFGFALDGRSSEDRNGDGILDFGEDLNGNQQIDSDEGVALVELSGDSDNLVIGPVQVQSDGAIANFSVSLIDPNSGGRGTVIVTDRAGNTCSAPVESAPRCSTITFESDGAGTPLREGTPVEEVFRSEGIAIKARSHNGRSQGLPIVFSSSVPNSLSVRNDPDLGTPNRKFGGPGIGKGGERTNKKPLGNVLIRAQTTTDQDGDGVVDSPNDNGEGAEFFFDFTPGGYPVCIESIDLLDIDSKEKAIFNFQRGGRSYKTVKISGLGDNAYQPVGFAGSCNCSTDSLKVTISRSGALDNLRFCRVGFKGSHRGDDGVSKDDD